MTSFMKPSKSMNSAGMMLIAQPVQSLPFDTDACGVSDCMRIPFQPVYRSDWGRIMATLIRLVGDFDVAQEAAQEAVAAAVDQWRTAGVPSSPRTWIIQTAKHKAIDRLRRRTRLTEKLQSLAEAAKSYSRALELVTNDRERRFLERRLRQVRLADP